MAIPISYNIRNLRLRKGLTAMTALGIALTVTTAIFLMALVAGLDRAFVSSGSPKNVLVLRKGSEAELSGGFDAALFPTLKTLPGIAKDSHGEPMASGEWVVVIVLPRKDGTGEVNVTVRGMMPDGLEMRQLPDGPGGQPKVKLLEGRWFETGQREVVVSDSIRNRFAHANIGDTMQFGKGSWKVVGVFDAGGSAYESEVWGDVNQMASDFDRQGGYSSAYLRATDPISAEALKNRVSDDQRLYFFVRDESILLSNLVDSHRAAFTVDEYAPPWQKRRELHGFGSCGCADERQVNAAVELCAVKFGDFRPTGAIWWLEPAGMYFIDYTF